MTTPQTQTPPLLLCEALGFSPQLLLDDIINIANNAVQDGVNGMEQFLMKWVDERQALPQHINSSESEWDTTQEVEQGLVAFQTLLEYHTDLAFDFFEAWCLRNIFYVPPELPVVLPHQAGLDLSPGIVEREKELRDEIDTLRAQLALQRRLKRHLNRSLIVSRKKRERAELRLSVLSTMLQPASDPSRSSLTTLQSLPPKLLKLIEDIQTLPPIDSIPTSESIPGKRQWETGFMGYENWAVERLMAKTGNGEISGGVNKLHEDAKAVGAPEEVSAAAEAAKSGTRDVKDKLATKE